MADSLEITIVSGLPRSGTSLMMQMLDRGGIPALTDHVRSPDSDNPHGYYEFERVKQIKRDQSWLPAARGCVVKMASPLLYDLPSSERYEIIIMQRELDEVLASQEKMLARLNQPAVPREKMKASFILHLERLMDWLPQQPQMRFLLVSYNELMENSACEVELIAEFLRGRVEADRMTEAIDRTLYRNKM